MSGLVSPKIVEHIFECKKVIICWHDWMHLNILIDFRVLFVLTRHFGPLQIYDFDRDYKDFGVARFTTKYFVVRNCLPNAKFDMILAPWNPPPEWGKYALVSAYLLHLLVNGTCRFFFL